MKLAKNREGNLVGDTHRECTNCGRLFEITSGMTICNSCNVTRVTSMTPEWRMHQRAKQRAKARGLDFNIEVSEIEIPDTCPILGIPLYQTTGKSGAFKNSPSLDRIDPNEGYIHNNIQVISQLANAMKHNATKDELISFAYWVLEVYGEDC